MSKTSELMKYFKEVEDESTVSCNLCDRHIKAIGKTALATMTRHLYNHDKDRLTMSLDNITYDASQTSHTLETSTKSLRKRRRIYMGDDIRRSSEEESEEENEEENEEESEEESEKDSEVMEAEMMSSYSDDEDAKISNAILYYMCVDDKPFNTIHCKGFKYLMKELASNCKIPSEKTIKRRLDEKYDVVVKIFKQQLNETLHVTISIDTWSEAVSCKSFLRITVHFIASGKDSKKLESGNIELIELSEYTVDYIASALSNALKTWCIDISKVAAVITNYESNIVKAVTQICDQYKHINHITCFAHTINLVAENSMKNCEGLSNIIDKVRLVVKFIKNSTDINNELHQRQVDLGTSKTEIKKLILDIDLRWNSTFYMIERFIELWTVIYVLLINHKTPDIKVPTDDELNMLKEIVVLLKPLAFMAEQCSTENYIVISKIIPLINCALIEYNKTTQMMELSMKLKEAILKELQSRFGQIEFSHSFSIATILDPRFKIIHFQNTQALANAMYQLHEMINDQIKRNELSSVSSFHESNTEQDKTKYDLWNHHKFLADKHKDELILYLAISASSLNDDPLEKWESMKKQFPSLYKIAQKYLSIVATSVPAERLFSKTEMTQSENQLTVERLNKLSFLNSVGKKYWSR